jgi:hypothetical protein
MNPCCRLGRAVRLRRRRGGFFGAGFFGAPLLVPLRAG